MRLKALAASLAALASGCTASSYANHSMYWPGVANAPSFTHRGQVSVAAHGNATTQWQAGAAYAITDHVMVRADGDYNFQVGGGGDAGLGWYWAETSQEGWRGSVDVDAGGGEFHDQLETVRVFGYDCGQPVPCTTSGTDLDKYSLPFVRGSVQTDAGFQAEKYYMGGVARLTQVQGKFHHEYKPGGQPQNPDPAVSEDEDEAWREVAAAMVFRYKITREASFDSQLGASVSSGSFGPVAQAAQEKQGGLWPWLVAVGLSVNF